MQNLYLSSKMLYQNFLCPSDTKNRFRVALISETPEREWHCTRNDDCFSPNANLCLALELVKTGNESFFLPGDAISACDVRQCYLRTHGRYEPQKSLGFFGFIPFLKWDFPLDDFPESYIFGLKFLQWLNQWLIAMLELLGPSWHYIDKCIGVANDGLGFF